MKRKDIILKEIGQLPFFNKEELVIHLKRFALSEHSVNAYLKSPDIIRFKRDFYVGKNTFNNNKADLSYVYFIANHLRTPSYISLESAMQFYHLSVETISSVVTSVTLNITRQYNTKLGKFIYRNLKEELFNYFETYTKGNYKFQIASPAKAIFDYLYFFSDFFRKKINNSIFDKLRIDVAEMSVKEKSLFNRLIKTHSDLAIKI